METTSDTCDGPTGGQRPVVAEPGRTPWCQQLVEAAPDGLLVTDVTGRIVFVNSRLEAMSGYAAAELIGEPAELLVPHAARARHAELHQDFRRSPRYRLMSEGRGLRLCCRDGSLLPVEIGLAPMRYAGTTMTVASVRDVSARLALEAERTRLLKLLDLLPDMVILVNAQTFRIDYVNPAVADLMGHQVSELIGEPVSRIDPGFTEAERHGTLAQLSVGDLSGVAVTRFLTSASGEAVPVELHRKVVVDGDGTRYVVAVARDMRARLAQEERLSASEQAFRTAFEQAPIGVEVVSLADDGSRSILMANQALADMFGCSVADLIGGSLARFGLPEDEPLARSQARALATGATRQLAALKQYRRPDGRTLWAEARMTRFHLPDAAGPVGLVHLVDVTDRMDRQLRQEREATLNACVAEVATAVLADEPVTDVLRRIVDGAQRLVHADSAALILLDRAGRFRTQAVAGELLLPMLHTDVPVDPGAWVDRVSHGTPVDRVSHGTPMTGPAGLAGPAGAPGPTGASASYLPAALDTAVGPSVLARFGVEAETPVGFLVAVRGRGDREFVEVDAEDLSRLAAQTQLAIHLSRARADQQRLALLEDRQRISRELHDGVIQDIIALGMQLSAEVARDSDPDRASRDMERLDRLEDVVRQLRRVVFELGVPAPQDFGDAVQDVVREAGRVLAHRPELRLTGAFGTVPPPVAEDALSVLREALSNVARHAAGAHCWVRLDVDDAAITVTVEDDGAGFPAHPVRGNGLANIEHRARARSGRATLGRSARGGARILWRCPLSEDPPAPAD